YEYQKQNDNVTEVNNIPRLKNHAQITYQKKPYPSIEILVPDSSFELGNSPSFRKHQWTSSADVGPDSIFIVMTNDKKNSMSTSQQVKNSNTDLKFGNDGPNSNSILIDYDYNLSFDLPTNDENLSLSRNVKTNPTYNNGSAVVSNVRLGDMFVQTSPESTIEKYTYFNDYNYTFSSDITSRLEHNKNVVGTKCQPACKSTHNEHCIFIDYSWRCSCRPGFAPTFTYTFSIQALRIRSYPVKYDKDFLNDTTDHFEHLVHTLYDAFDRMVMQSDFRDVYNGIQLANFSVNKNPENKQTKLTYDNLIVNFLLQLSKKSNEKRLQEVFKRQLRLSNYSIGGTDLYTTQSGADSLVIMGYLLLLWLVDLRFDLTKKARLGDLAFQEVSKKEQQPFAQSLHKEHFCADFDECNNHKFHDCSSNAQCFNLKGTYTCSCREGFIDLSKNNIHPGRLCSAEIIGCAQCQYQGKCTLSGLKSNSYICECFLWYTGANCGVNLKIFLIGFIAAGSFLFSLLLFSVLLTYIRRKKVCGLDSSILTCITIPDNPDFNRDKEIQSTFPHCTSQYYNSSSNCVHNVSGAMSTAKSKKKSIMLEKCAIIKDSSSDSSENSVISALRTVSS
uniref:EGF-like domain-containing protein n=1 Tax=Glossina morsitans morsitans TaxID=37546 RepID=A0A1B0FBN7_GLOMM